MKKKLLSLLLAASVLLTYAPTVLAADPEPVVFDDTVYIEDGNVLVEYNYADPDHIISHGDSVYFLIIDSLDPTTELRSSDFDRLDPEGEFRIGEDYVEDLKITYKKTGVHSYTVYDVTTTPTGLPSTQPIVITLGTGMSEADKNALIADTAEMENISKSKILASSSALNAIETAYLAEQLASGDFKFATLTDGTNYYADEVAAMLAKGITSPTSGYIYNGIYYRDVHELAPRLALDAKVTIGEYYFNNYNTPLYMFVDRYFYNAGDTTATWGPYAGAEERDYLAKYPTAADATKANLYYTGTLTSQTTELMTIPVGGTIPTDGTQLKEVANVFTALDGNMYYYNEADTAAVPVRFANVLSAYASPVKRVDTVYTTNHPGLLQTELNGIIYQGNYYAPDDILSIPGVTAPSTANPIYYYSGTLYQTAASALTAANVRDYSGTVYLNTVGNVVTATDIDNDVAALVDLSSVAPPTVTPRSVTTNDYRYFLEIETEAYTGTKDHDIVGWIGLGRTKNDAEDYAVDIDFTLESGKYDDGVAQDGDVYISGENDGVVEFDDEADEMWVFWGDEAFFVFDASNQDELNLGYNTDFDWDLADRHGYTNVDFLNFVAQPRFNRSGDFYIYADEDKHIYELEDGVIKEISGLEYDEDEEAWTFRTNQLTSYIIADDQMVLTDVNGDFLDPTPALPNTTVTGGTKPVPFTGR